MSTKMIYVGNLPSSSTEKDLVTLFGQHGLVASVSVIRNGETGRTRGYAFVEMQDAGEAADAIRSLDRSVLGGHTLKVSEAQDRRGGGTGYGGNRY